MSGVDAFVCRVASVLEYPFPMWYGFRQVAYAFEGVTLGAWFA